MQFIVHRQLGLAIRSIGHKLTEKREIKGCHTRHTKNASILTDDMNFKKKKKKKGAKVMQYSGRRVNGNRDSTRFDFSKWFWNTTNCDVSNVCLHFFPLITLSLYSFSQTCCDLEIGFGRRLGLGWQLRTRLGMWLCGSSYDSRESNQLEGRFVLALPGFELYNEASPDHFTIVGDSSTNC